VAGPGRSGQGRIPECVTKSSRMQNCWPCGLPEPSPCPRSSTQSYTATSASILPSFLVGVWGGLSGGFFHPSGPFRIGPILFLDLPAACPHPRFFGSIPNFIAVTQSTDGPTKRPVLEARLPHHFIGSIGTVSDRLKNGSIVAICFGCFGCWFGTC
jgi:hypothetical protein